MNKVALITGASSGIGRELAVLHAKNGGDMVLVARSKGKLDYIKEELESEYGVKVLVISKDLSMPGAAKAIYAEVKSKNIQVEYLMNNAGFGGQGYFHERDLDKDMAMIQVNITALTELTRLFLPEFVSLNKGKILNTSSIAAKTPGPLQAVYFATKAYVTSFTQAIAQEVAETEVTATALMPGATESGFAKVADMGNTEAFKKTTPAEVIAKAGYEGMLEGKLTVIAGVSIFQRIMLGIAPFLPKDFVLRTMMKMQLKK